MRSDASHNKEVVLQVKGSRQSLKRAFVTAASTAPATIRQLLHQALDLPGLQFLQPLRARLLFQFFLSNPLFTMRQLLVLVLAAAAAVLVAGATCPPPNFDSVRDFDIKKYVSAPWYIQEQMPNAYQPADQLFCVRALYIPKDPSDLNKGIQVINSARESSVSGTVMGSAGSGASSSSSGRTGANMALIAFPETTLTSEGKSDSPSGASKLRVGPAFLAERFLAGSRDIFGPYWVVAVGPSADGSNYDWAIVSGGPPKTSSKDGCVVGPLNPGPQDVNNSGLWLFSRKPIDPANTAIMRDQAKKLGFDLSVLKKVKQEGCTYPSTNPGSSSGSNTGSGSKGQSGRKLI